MAYVLGYLAVLVPWLVGMAVILRRVARALGWLSSATVEGMRAATDEVYRPALRP